jgi:hypothetical protein
MALGEELAATADALKRYLAQLYGGLRQIAGDIGYGLGRIYGTTPGKLALLGVGAGAGAAALGTGIGIGLHGYEIGEFGGNPLNPLYYLGYIPYSPYAPPPQNEPPQKFIESTSLGAFFNPLVLTIIIVLIIVIVFLIATRK